MADRLRFSFLMRTREADALRQIAKAMDRSQGAALRTLIRQADRELANMPTPIAVPSAEHGGKMRAKTKGTKAHQIERVNAHLEVKVSHGRLQLSVDLPLYLLLIVLGTIAASAGYPMLEQIVRAIVHG